MLYFILKNDFDSFTNNKHFLQTLYHLAAIKAPMIVRTTNQKAKFRKDSWNSHNSSHGSLQLVCVIETKAKSNLWIDLKAIWKFQILYLWTDLIWKHVKEGWKPRVELVKCLFDQICWPWCFKMGFFKILVGDSILVIKLNQSEKMLTLIVAFWFLVWWTFPPKLSFSEYGCLVIRKTNERPTKP